MRIALFHNRYKQPGGEDVVVDFEHRLLERAGHEVRRFEVANGDRIADSGFAKLRGAALTAVQAGWNHDSMRSVLAMLEDYRPDVGHVHNWFPLLSPSIYEAHRVAGVPVVQTLHNYRLFCARGTCWDGERVCRDCVDGKRSRAIRRGCYRDSHMQSAIWWRTMAGGWRSGAFQSAVDAYLAPSEIVRDLHVEAGLPAEKIQVVPNACEDPGFRPFEGHKPSAVFVGRLEEEKGIRALLEGWRALPWTLHVIGQGSLSSELMNTFGSYSNIHFHGQQPPERVQALVQQSSIAVFPSLWHEPFGLGVIEAMACGRPVVTGGPGAPGTLIEHGVSGIHIPEPGPISLSKACEELLGDPDLVRKMGARARERYEQCYSPAAHLRQLMASFERLVNRPEEMCA